MIFRLFSYFSRVKARFAESSDNEESDQSEESESDNSDNSNNEEDEDDEEGSGSDHSLLNSDEDSPRPVKKSRDSSSRRSSHASAGDSERKSGRARKVVDSYFQESESDEDNVSTPSNKRRRDGSLDHTASSKKARDMSPEDYSAIYRRELPAKIAEYSSQIASTTNDATIRYLSILRALQQDASTEVFWEPVDLKAVPSYKHFISKPMDLGTIRTKVMQGKYATDEQFAEVIFCYIFSWLFLILKMLFLRSTKQMI